MGRRLHWERCKTRLVRRHPRHKHGEPVPQIRGRVLTAIRIQQNYGWVIMAVVLVVASVLAVVLGTWYKRRRARRLGPNTLATQDVNNALRDPHPQTQAPRATSRGGPAAPVLNSGWPAGGRGTRAPPPVPAYIGTGMTQVMPSGHSNASAPSHIYTRQSARSPSGKLRPMRGPQRSISFEGPTTAISNGMPPEFTKGKGRVDVEGIPYSTTPSPMPFAPEQHAVGSPDVGRPSSAARSKLR
jgi:type II secretory pathway pseudopilin PulG